MSTAKNTTSRGKAYLAAFHMRSPHFVVTEGTRHQLVSLLTALQPAPGVPRKVPAIGVAVSVHLDFPTRSGQRWDDFVRRCENNARAHASVANNTARGCLRGADVVPVLYAAGSDTSAGAYVTVQERVRGVPIVRNSTITPFMLAQVEKALFTCWLLGVESTQISTGSLVADASTGAVKFVEVRSARRMATWRADAIASAIATPAKFAQAWDVANRSPPVVTSDVHLLRRLRTLVVASDVEASLQTAREGLWARCTQQQN